MQTSLNADHHVWTRLQKCDKVTGSFSTVFLDCEDNLLLGGKTLILEVFFVNFGIKDKNTRSKQVGTLHSK